MATSLEASNVVTNLSSSKQNNEANATGCGNSSDCKALEFCHKRDCRPKSSEAFCISTRAGDGCLAENTRCVFDRCEILRNLDEPCVPSNSTTINNGNCLGSGLRCDEHTKSCKVYIYDEKGPESIDMIPFFVGFIAVLLLLTLCVVCSIRHCASSDVRLGGRWGHRRRKTSRGNEHADGYSLAPV